MDQVLELPWRNGFKASRTRLFFIFCQAFVIFDDFSKWSALKVMRNFEKSSKIWQKKKKVSCSTYLKPIFRLIPGTRSATNIYSQTKNSSCQNVFLCLSRQKVDMRGHWFSSRPMTYTSIFMQFSGGKITKSQGVMVVNCATKSEKTYYAFGKLALYLSQNLNSSSNRDIYV